MSTTAVPGTPLFEQTQTRSFPSPTARTKSATPASPTTSPEESDAIFSAVELERFREEDAEAGRQICTILTSLFTVCVLLASGVIAWTFLYAV